MDIVVNKDGSIDVTIRSEPDPKPGDAVVLDRGVVGVALKPGSVPVVEGTFVGPNMVPVATIADVYVRPVTDVLAGGLVAVLPGGGLAMRKRGRPRKGTIVLRDAKWGSNVKAGELALLHLGLAMRKKIGSLRVRRLCND